MKTEELEKVYNSRPFKIRNADEFDIENILDLFIDPTDGLNSPFDFTNSIIKGKMGSGKTMYLRANHAYYLYTLVPCLNENEEIILPVYIKLSSFSNIQKPEDIYNAILVNIVEEIAGVCKHLQSPLELVKLHRGATSILELWPTNKAISQVLGRLQKLTAEEYVTTVTDSINGTVGASPQFFNICAAYAQNVAQEIKRKDRPSFQCVIDACNELVLPFDGKVLFLFDEVGSINKSFFRASDDADSLFETLMNQLRTLPYVRTKIAVYPNSASDILQETRYGDCIELECDVVNNENQYANFLGKTASLIERYIEKGTGIKCCAEDVFEMTVQNQLLLEQLVNASEGNMRRLVHLLDLSMNAAFIRCYGKEKVKINDVIDALKKQGGEMESCYHEGDIDFLNRLVRVCRNRSTYRFSFPYKSTVLNRYTNKSAEYNIINICQAGTGRQGTVYSFDYVYCVYKDIPTHYIRGSEKLDKTRSNKTGEPIKRIAQLSEEIMIQADIRGKVEGSVVFLSDEGTSGSVRGDDGKDYFLLTQFLIESDRRKPIHTGSRIRFLPSLMPGNEASITLCTYIEILE